LGSFSSEIDASWLGTVPTAEDLGDGGQAASEGPVEAGA
jgi:hypothetical protein